jgi:hypothetical protein
MEITEGGQSLPGLAWFYFRDWRWESGVAGKTGMDWERSGKTGNGLGGD